MPGIHGGVQAQMKGAGYHNATYVDCASHRRLNLVLAATAERHPMIKSFFDTLDLTYSFMNGTKRHTAFVDVQHERYPNVHVHVVLVGLPVLWRWRGFCVGLIAFLIL